MKQLPFLLVVIALATPLAAGAFEPGKVTLPVADRTADERAEVLADGLRRVLIRLTGMRHPEDSPSVAALLEADPARWVLQYSYVAPASSGGPEESDKNVENQAGDEPAMLLSARFDVAGLSERLAEVGAPVWGTERPSVLLWVVEQGPGRGEFLGRDDRGEEIDVLRETAADRGLPIILPRLDGTDRGHVRPADVRGLFDDPVMEASQRYEAGLVATAVLYRGSAPHLRWRIFEQGRQVRQGDIARAGGETALLAELVHRLADYVAGLYAVRSGSGRAVTLRIRELSDLADWKAAHDHLTGLAGMQALHVQQLEGTTATFSGRFAGNPEQLDRLIRLQPALRGCPDVAAPAMAPALAAEAGEIGDEAPAQLEFCWDHDG